LAQRPPSVELLAASGNVMELAVKELDPPRSTYGVD